jgi:multidrug efflux system membrane fusion protein
MERIPKRPIAPIPKQIYFLRRRLHAAAYYMGILAVEKRGANMRITSVLAALAVAIGIFLWVNPFGRSAPENGASAAADAAPAAQGLTTVMTYLSAPQPLETVITLRGRTEADKTLDVRAETEGLVISDAIRKGAQVAEGDLLCQIAPGSRLADLAEANAKQAQSLHEAALNLSRKGILSATEAATRLANLEAARATVATMELDIERLEIHAPFDGRLETDTAERGALLRVGDACATVIALDPIKLIGYAPEREVDKLRIGATAQARLSTGAEVEGVVSFVSRSADPDTRTFLVEVQAANPDGAIRDGLTAEIYMPVRSAPAHLAPRAALTLDSAGRLGVKIVKDGVVAFVPVAIERDTSEGVWISGLEGEAEIVVVGQEFVTDGREVKTARLSPEDVK